MVTRAEVFETVDAELVAIADAECAGAIRELLVEPRCEHRGWDYGQDDITFPCWIVLEHKASNTCIAYCEYGFGPACPWGLIFMEGPWLSMGMDSQWFSYLEDAFRDSPAWCGENPPGYEIR